MNKTIKSVRFHINESNKEKLKLIDQTFTDYKNLVNEHIKKYLNSVLYEDVYLNNSRSKKLNNVIKNIKYFDSHYSQQANKKAINILSKYYNNIFDKIDFSEEKKLNKHLLHWINSFTQLRFYLNFNEKEKFFNKLKSLEDKFEDKNIKDIFEYCENNYDNLHKIFNESYIKSKANFKIPEYKANSIQLDARIAEMQRGNNTFDYWFKLKTSKTLKQSGKTHFNQIIYLPFKINDYIRNKLKIAKSFVLKKDEYNNYFFQGVYQIDSIKNVSTKEVGIDIGYKKLVNTSDGYQSSKLYNSKMNKLDKVISLLRKNLQQQGITNSKKLQRLENKRKQLQKCFIGQEVNKILDKGYKTIVVENLDFKKKHNHNFKRKHSKVMIRRLSIHKKMYLLKLLRSHATEKETSVIGVNPAYTSQLCSRCGYLHEDNRVNQWLFICKHCGLRINADINASNNILRRSKDSELLNCTDIGEIKSILIRRFESNHGRNNNPLDLDIVSKEMESLKSIKSEVVNVY